MAYDVAYERLGLSALFDLKGAEAAVRQWLRHPPLQFPRTPNTRSRSRVLELWWVGADHWLLRAPLEQEEQLLDKLSPMEAPEDISVVHVSDTLTFFAITGPDAEEVLSVTCPLDLASFGEDAVSYTEVFGLKGIVLRRPQGFEVAVERSFGDMMLDHFAGVTGHPPT